MKKEQKMNAKNLMVTFCTLALALFLVGSVSALPTNTYYGMGDVTVDGIVANYDGTVSVVAGEEFTVKVYFTPTVNDTNVIITATIEGEKVEFDASTSVFDVIADRAYRKVLTLKVPYELKDVINDSLELNIEIDGKEYKTEDTFFLTVQRPSYNAVVRSVTTPSAIQAGELFPIEIVLTNMGFNNLDNVYVTAEIVELGVSQGPKWIGDLVTLEDCDDDCDKEDTVMGRLYLQVPYSADAGVYTLKVTVENDDTETVEVRKIVLGNEFSESVIASGTSKTVAKGEEAKYELLIVNPTNNVKVYNVVASSDVASTNQIVAVPAGSSKVVEITASSKEEGLYTFDVNVLSAGKLESTQKFDLNVEGKSVNSVVVLTIVLAIIFLVLLVVLIVLLGRKPEKTEDFGESYY